MNERKILISIEIVTIIILGIVASLFFINQNKKIEIAEEKITDDCIEEEKMYELGLLNNIEEVSSTAEKVSPNSKFIIEKKYEKCGHSVKEEVELPKEMINKTQEEIEKMYKDFQVESFSTNEVILSQIIKEICDEHYRVKIENGVIVIYNLDENNNEKLKEKTEISEEYLTKEDITSLKKGIEIYGKQKLNSYLEDFE